MTRGVRVGGEPQRVVHVEQPLDGVAQLLLVRAGRGHRHARRALQAGPAAGLVDVPHLQPGLVQELPQRRHASAELVGRQQRLQLALHRRSARRDGRPDVLEDDVRGHPVQLHRAAGRQEREALLDLLLHLRARGAGHRAVAQVEAELPVRLADEVQHGDAVLALEAAQAAAKLLQEDERAFRGPEEQQRVDLGQVDAFVEQVHREQRPDAPGAQVQQRLLARRRCRCWRTPPATAGRRR